jgi:hypothetical protein
MKKVLIIILIILIQGCEETRQVETLVSFERKYFFDEEIKDKLEKDTVNWKYQLYADKHASKGNYTKALQGWDDMFKR